MIPNNLRVLNLNADYVPLGTVNWKRAMARIHGEKSAIVVEYYDGLYIRDGKGNSYGVPSVIVNKKHIHRNYRKVPFSKNNILRRDNFYCAYCYKRFDKSDLTLDHVVPRSMWKGKDSPTNWTNIVACCLPCNHKKANRTPEQAGMRLGKYLTDGRLVFYDKPKQPTYMELVVRLSDHIPAEWLVYLSSIKDKYVEVQKV